MVLGSLYSTMAPAPSDDTDKQVVRYSDGTVVEYDRAAHKLRLDADVEITGDVKFTGNVEITGNVEAGGEVEDGIGTVNEIRGTYNTHTHGAAPGPAVPAPNERMEE